MKVKNIIILLLLTPVALSANICTGKKNVLPSLTGGGGWYNGRDTRASKDTPRLGLSVNIRDIRQTIHSFGASDGWTCQIIGRWADLRKKSKIADLLFSMDTAADGSPKGIGLSLWRFNIGAGSYEQGDSSYIKDPWRREECFLNSDGTYNWNKQAGQQWFLQAARQRGVAYTLGFAVSPPVFMTRNGKAFSPGGKSLNIQNNRLRDYADFLTRVAGHFHFNYISPV
ncbi:MAG TPA: glycoside hydrolase, partial [Chitinophagaceae bacterium]